NNWVLSGARTLSGSPLLANDPHLAFTAPSLWYLAHLAMPDGPLVGGTIPGFPTIFLGHNGQAAWGMTNTGTDVRDVVVLALTDEGRAYQTSDGPVAFTTRTEKIGVRFGKDETLSLLSGPFGRALPASSARLRGLDPAETLLGLQWTLFEPGDLTAVAAIDAPKAKDWSSFVTALDDFSVPMQNVVYADASGRIGLVMRSRVPTRPLGHPSRGLYPAPAKAAATTWSGFVSTGELPTLADPPDGLIITANNQIVPDDYPHYLTSEWAPAYRARRLTEQLNDVGQTDLDYSADLQIDNTSLFARDLLPTLLKTPAPSPNAEAVLDTLRGWDGDMHKDRAEPLIFMAWMHALSTAVLADDFGKDYDGVLPFRPQFLEGVVTENPSAAPWCDDQTTDALEPCSALLGPALVKALEALEATYGSDREAWRWGAAHEAVHEHLPFAGFPVIDRFFNIRVDTGGGPYTPNQGGINLASDRPFQNRHGAGFRGLYDLSNLDASHFMIATGQSGNPLSKWYRNFSEPWADGVYLTIPTDPEVYRAEAAGIWVLRPPEPSP
ncbi:MAG: penicillin acylase family protein, partial [Pseudomonadota bacterium]